MGIKSVDAINSISIYPNPSTGMFTVSFGGTEKVRLMVTNLLGQTIGNAINVAPGFNSCNIDLRNQPSGVYLLQISSGDKTVTKRLVVEK